MLPQKLACRYAVHSGHTRVWIIEIDKAVNPSIHVLSVELGETKCLSELLVEGPPVSNSVAVYRHSRSDHGSTITYNSETTNGSAKLMCCRLHGSLDSRCAHPLMLGFGYQLPEGCAPNRALTLGSQR